ncbi:MAG: PEP-CTERM sorting domain-containing protein [Nostoc sp.]
MNGLALVSGSIKVPQEVPEPTTIMGTVVFGGLAVSSFAKRKRTAKKQH